MRSRKSKEVNIFSASVVDLFASGLGVFLIVAIIALVNQKKETAKTSDSKEELLFIKSKIKKLEGKVRLLKTENEILKIPVVDKTAENKKFLEKIEQKINLDKEISEDVVRALQDKIEHKDETIHELEKKIKNLLSANKKLSETQSDLNLKAENFKVGAKVQLGNVQFYAGTNITIEPYASREMTQLGQILLQEENMEVEISGHIFLTKDELARGDVFDESNLSQRRANVVCRHLIKMGISQTRLICKGYGGKKYLYLTNDQYSREAQLNRRVEVEVLKNTKSSQ